MTTTTDHLTHTLAQTKDTFSLLQITDIHLYETEAGELLGVNTRSTFKNVLAHAQKHHSDADAVFFTGDIAQEASNQVYVDFKEHADSLNKPYFSIAGNHDDPAKMALSLPGSDYHQVVETKHWHFILLNSFFDGSPAGFLSDASLDWLKTILRTTTHKHVGITLHHHPVAMESEWIDNHMLKQSEAFWNVVDQFSHVKTVFWGHVHQGFVGERNGIKLFAAPATSAQFKPKSNDFSVDAIASGYRSYRFFKDGSLETEVERLHYIPEKLKLTSEGY